VLVSDQAGRANLLQRFAAMGLDVDPDPGQTAELLAAIKERESSGYSYDGATASFELLVRRALGDVPSYFGLQSFRVMDEHRFNALGQRVVQSEATIKVTVGDAVRHQVADGNGPVNALDLALRAALSPAYPSLEGMRLTDYKVRIVSPRAGTAAVTRVVIESEDDRGRLWRTVGVSENIIEASFEALEDSITYKLVLDGVRAPAVRA
jgi:2-isopropylmalate synthase